MEAVDVHGPPSRQRILSAGAAAKSSATAASSDTSGPSSSTSVETRTAASNKRAASAAPNEEHAPVASTKRAKRNRVPTGDEAGLSTEALQNKIAELEGQVRGLQTRNTRLERERRAEKDRRTREVGQSLARIHDLERQLREQKTALREAQDHYFNLVATSMGTLRELVGRFKYVAMSFSEQIDMARRAMKTVIAMAPLFELANQFWPAEAQQCSQAAFAELHGPLASDVRDDQESAEFDQTMAGLDAFIKWSELVQSSTEAVLRCRNDATLAQLAKAVREVPRE